MLGAGVPQLRRGPGRSGMVGVGHVDESSTLVPQADEHESRRMVAVGTTKKSAARIWLAWFMTVNSSGTLNKIKTTTDC
ncbi:MAG: hypothetical protein ACRD2N_16150 [Vicinamibacterales bacterium]